MKKYLRDLELKEIIENLKKGLQIKNDVDNCKFFMVDNIICFLDFEGDKFINSGIPCSEDIWYFEIEEPFEIKETGLYKTRDGRRAFVSCISNDDVFNVIGIIEGYSDRCTWTSSGRYNAYNGGDCCTDIVSKWEE